jgi:enediyne polyketide synthase
MRKAGEIDVALRSEESGFQVDHFRTICRFASGVERLRGSEPKPSIVVPPSAPIALDIAQDIYADLLFHTGRFRRVKNYRLLKAKECIVQVEPDADAVWFGRHLPQERVLGDTGVRDAAIHAIQACIPHARLLPIGVDRIVIGKIPCLLERVRAMGKVPELLLHACERFRDGDTFCYDLQLLGEDGSVLEQWDGLRLRKVETLSHRTAWTQALLGPYIERSLEELIPGRKITVALGDPTGEVRHRSDGKPEIDGPLSVSVAHSWELTLTVTGPAPIGCDIEVVATRPWRDLLSRERFALADQIDEPLDTAATRVWTALECLKKAGVSADAPLVLNTSKPDGWILLSSGPRTVATYLHEGRVFSVLA